MFLLVVTIFPAFGQEEFSGQKITINSDNTAYQEGDVITITGSIEKPIAGMPITIQIYFGVTLVEVAQVSVSQDGKFSETFRATGPMWQNEGTVLIKASYGKNSSAELYVDFFKTSDNSLISSYEVNIPNGGTFDVEYTIKGGIVSSMELNQKDFAIDVNIVMNSDGLLDLKLPRNSIDAVNNNGDDMEFIVIIYTNENVDSLQTEFNEGEITSEFRTISIPIKNGDEKIQIIGTHVIPEFGTIIQIVLVVAIITTIIFTRTKLSITS